MDLTSVLSALCQRGGALQYIINQITLRQVLQIIYMEIPKSQFTCLSLMQILRTYKTDPKVEQMLKNLDLYVTPVLNVDGYTYTWTDNTVCHYTMHTCMLKIV